MTDISRASTGATSIRASFGSWDRYQRAFVDGLRRRTADELAVRIGEDAGPVWAIAAHVAGARVFWLSGVFGEPGADATPFSDPFGAGWEDDLTTPRTADELVWALESSWSVIEGCLDRWTPAMLSGTATRATSAGPQVHTRESVLVRLLTHDAFHAGEISLALGSRGYVSLDLWAPPRVAPAS